jgi:hypothetical protein
LWDIHGVPRPGQKMSEIEKVTGVTSLEDYLNNPEAQEKYQKHLANNYESNVGTLRKKHNISDQVPDETLMMLQHFLGLGDTNVYLSTLMNTNSYEAAQEAVNESIRNRTGKPAPKNALIIDYLDDFQKKLGALTGSKTETKTEAKTQPQVSAPKQEPTLTANPTFTASPFAKPEATKAQPKTQPTPQTKVQPQSPVKAQEPVDSRFKVLPDSLPKKENKPAPSKPVTKNELSKAIESRFNIKPTDQQLNILMDDNLSSYEKGRKLGIIPDGKGFSGPQNVSNPNRAQEMWQTLVDEGIGAFITQTFSGATSPNEGLEQKVAPLPEPNVNNEKSKKVTSAKVTPKPEEEEPYKVTLGSKVENYGGNSDRYIEPFRVNVKSAKFGVRSRGEEQDIATEGAVFTTFKPWTYAASPEYVNEFNYYLVVNKATGTLEIATNPKQNKNSILNKQEVKGNPQMVTTGTYGRLAKSLNLNGTYNDGISTKTLGYVSYDGKQASLPTFGIGKDGSELGGYKGGKLILSKQDGTDPVIVYGSAQIVINEFNKYKKKHNIENVLVLDADGKSYAQSYQTKSKVIKGSDLRSGTWDNANTSSAGSGNILYLK